MIGNKSEATCNVQWSVTALKGIIRKPAKPVSIKDMTDATADQAASAQDANPPGWGKQQRS